MLRLAPDLVVRFQADSEVFVERGATQAGAGPHGIAILETFRTATAYKDALDRLSARTTGMQDWIELSATISDYVRLGILQDVSELQPVLSHVPGRFDAPRVQILMLDDRTRTGSFIEAIHEVVRPGDVVVDLGTGTGVLAVAAAQAGASRVYAIEATRIGDAARKVFEANGFGDRITLVEGLSTRVELPERADVLVSEIIGRDPLEEEIFEFTRDAVQRFLKPGARLIPSSLEVDAIPLMFPDELRRGWTFTAEAVAQWKEIYGIDFSPLVDVSARSPFSMAMSPKRLAATLGIAEPISMLRRDLADIRDLSFTATAVTPALHRGRIDAVGLSFTARLSPGVSLTNDPRVAREDSSWDHIVWGLPTPVPVEKGEAIEVTVRHRMDGPPLSVRAGGG